MTTTTALTLHRNAKQHINPMTQPPLAKLKKHTWKYWEELHLANGFLVQPEKFKDEVREFGDLRRKATWKKAIAFFYAKACYLYVDDPVSLVTKWLQPTNTWEREMWDDMIEQFLQLPKGLELVQCGLMQLYGNNYQPHSEDEKHGLSRLVQSAAQLGRLRVGGTQGRTNNGLLLQSGVN